jgi:hypothetical protein
VPSDGTTRCARHIRSGSRDARTGALARAVYLDVPLPVCLDRNAAPGGPARVPVVGVLATRNRLVPPALAHNARLRLRVDPDHAGVGDLELYDRIAEHIENGDQGADLEELAAQYWWHLVCFRTVVARYRRIGDMLVGDDDPSSGLPTPLRRVEVLLSPDVQKENIEPLPDACSRGGAQGPFRRALFLGIGGAVQRGHRQHGAQPGEHEHPGGCRSGGREHRQSRTGEGARLGEQGYSRACCDGRRR